MSGQPGFFDVNERLRRLSDLGGQLEAFGAAVDFELFRPVLDAALEPVQRSPIRCGIHGWAEACEFSVVKRRRRGWRGRTARTCGIG